MVFEVFIRRSSEFWFLFFGLMLMRKSFFVIVDIYFGKYSIENKGNCFFLLLDNCYSYFFNYVS